MRETRGAIDVTYHFKKRCVEREMKLKFNDRDMREFIRLNNVDLTLKALAMWNQSEFIWKGQLAENLQITNFYLHQPNTILVADASNQCLLTMYKIELPFPPEIAQVIVSTAMKRIRELREEEPEPNHDLLHLIEQGYNELDELSRSISTLKAQIAEMQRNLQAMKSERENLIRNLSVWQKEAAKKVDKSFEYVKIICNSVAVKKEFEEMREEYV
jgi:hypothetical protein